MQEGARRKEGDEAGVGDDVGDGVGLGDGLGVGASGGPDTEEARGQTTGGRTGTEGSRERGGGRRTNISRGVSKWFWGVRTSKAGGAL